MNFQSEGCPLNCEICRKSICLVCKRSFRLNQYKLCEYKDSTSFYCDSCRNKVFGKVNTRTFSSTSVSNILQGYEHYSFLVFGISYKKMFSSAWPNKTTCKFIVDTTFEVLDRHLNWRFNNANTSPYVEFEQSLDNFNSQIIKRSQTKFVLISSDHCSINSIELSHLTPYCETTRKAKSLKGASHLRFCENYFFDITYNKHMIYPSLFVPDNNFYYQMRVPGTSHTLYGKCTNNCICWDGNLDTVKGYNSCFLDPVTNKKCPPGYRLRKYSFGESREECIPEISCPSSCATCNSNSECLSCRNDLYSVNIISPLSGTVYCRECSEGCLSCSGPSASECNCHQDLNKSLQIFVSFTMNKSSAVFDRISSTCTHPVDCVENCLSCFSTTSCKKCSENHRFDSNLRNCVLSKFKKCFRSDPENSSNCLYCPQKTYLTNEKKCLPCPSNCLHCDNEHKCLICKDGFRLSKGICMNYSPFVSGLAIEEAPSLKNNELIDSYKLIKISSFYDFNTNSVLDYDFYLNSIDTLSKDPNLDFDKYLSKFVIENFRKTNSFKCKLMKKNQFDYEINQKSDNNHLLKLSLKECTHPKRKYLCQKCTSGFYFDKLTKKCSQIKSRFVKELQFNRVRNKLLPVKCSLGHFLDPKLYKCITSIAFCSKMQDNRRCKSCFEGYQLGPTRESCFKCPKHCLECSSDVFCVQCEKGFFISSDKGKT